MHSLGEAPRTRTVRALTLAGQLQQDLRLAIRRLRATPVFTAFAAVSLALALGVTTAIYSTIGALLWTTSSIEDAEHLAVVTRQQPGTSASWRWAMSRPDFDDLRSQARSVSSLAASSVMVDALNDGTQTSAFTAQAVTGNYFATVRLPLQLGRGIQEADDRPGADAVVVLSHNFWQSKAGGNAAIVGRTVRIGGHPFVVAGVASERIQSARDPFGRFGLVDGDGWIPLVSKSIVTGVLTAARDEPDLVVVARMPVTTAPQVVAAEVRGIGAALDRSAPILRGDPAGGLKPVPRSWSVTTAAAIAREPVAATGTAGGAAVLLVGLVLVVACTNIANLTLGRGASRVHEFTVRRALGASRGRLIREQCAESVVLAAFGGLGAFLVAKILCQYLTLDFPTGTASLQMIALQPKLSAPALMAAGGALLVSLVVFGVVPALQLTRASLLERLAGDAVGASPTRWKGRRRLIAWQVTISTAFMLIAAASMRAVTAEALHDPGFDLHHLAVGYASLRPLHVDADRARRVIEALDAAAHAQPGFESVALTASLPMGVRQIAEVGTGAPPATRQAAVAMLATPGIFRTLGVPILRGRGFDDRDTATTHPVIVASEQIARRVFGTTDAVGRQMSYQGASDAAPKTVEVIGVARDTDTLALFDRRIGAVYVPLSQHDAQTAIIVGRTSGDPAPMARTFAGMARQADRDLAVQFASTGLMAMAPGYVVLRGVATLAGGLSILAVTLAMLGLYGVLSHIVGRRTREIGLRLALGAEASGVRRMIVGEGLRPVVWGLAFGLLVGVGARLVLRATSTAPAISAVDPLAFAVAAVTLAAAGLFACYLPARRASKVDPNVALRDL
jgi:putative ABC transport system permease protein